MTELNASIRYGDLDLTAAPYLWEYGGELGTPELVVEALQQQLQDGEVVSADRSSNREIELTILVETDDLAAQADAEAALALEAAKPRNTLVYDPGDGIAAATVFDTFVAKLAFQRDDDMEQNGLRRWVLTIPALPFARSEELTTVSIPAPPASVTTVVIDDGSATTNWSGSGTPSVSGGTVRVGLDPFNTTWLQRNALAVTMGTTPYLRVVAGSLVSSFLANFAVVRTNLVPNPSFETNTTGWGGLNGTVLTRVNTAAFSGSYSMVLSSPGTNQSGCVTNPTMPATGGQTYTASVYVRAVTTARLASLNVTFYSGTGTTLGSTVVQGNTVVGSWTRLVATLTAPAGTTQAAIFVSFEGPTADQQYIDGVLFEQASSAGAYFDGATPDTSTSDYAWTGTAHASTSTLSQGTTLSVLAQSGSTYWLDTSAIGGTLTSFRVTYPPSSGYGYVDEIARTNALTIGTTGRENFRTVDVHGSARAQANLALVDATPAALGSTLVYTSPVIASMAQPPLRNYLVAGPTVTPDSSLVSGARTPLSTAHNFDVPATGIQAGGHLLLARIRHASAATYTLTWSGKSRMGTTDDVGQSGTTDVALAANTWTIVTVAALNLPTRKLGSSGIVRLTLSAPAGVELDEAWLFNVETGRLSWVECGTGAPSSGGSASRLWLDAASLDNPEPSISLGTASDRSDELGAGEKVLSFGVHEFAPPQVNVFTATSGSTAAAIVLSYFPRWHTHVGSS